MRPDPAPITWMIEAHSAFESMSDTDAFWTLRILPRMGRSAWYSLLRASFAVPSAESPSTMKSSVPSTSFDRQSASFVGSEEFSSAFLRRCVSLCARAEMRVFISATTFSSTTAAWAFSVRCVEVRISVIRFETTESRIRRTAGVPRISFVCPSNCGSGRRTVSTAVRPASTSSFSSLSWPTLSLRALASTWARTALTRPDSNPAWCVPPFGVAMMLTKLRNTVSYPSPQRRATSTSHVRSTSVETMWPLSSSIGTVSLKVPVPWMRHTSVFAPSTARCSTNSPMPPSYRKRSTTGPCSRTGVASCSAPAGAAPSDAPASGADTASAARWAAAAIDAGRASVIVSPSPGTRNAVCRARLTRSPVLNAASLVKICRSAQ